MFKEYDEQEIPMPAFTFKAERRASKRFELNVEMKYITDTMDTFEAGVLHDLSFEGALISVQRPLTLNTCIELITQSNHLQEKSIHIAATLLRVAPNHTEGVFTYGCRIDLYFDLDEVGAGIQ